MPQFNTFYIPMGDEGEAAERLNAFLRSHRVLTVRQRDFPEGWGFCVEWMQAAPGTAGAPFSPPRERVDYMKVLPPEAFRRFCLFRAARKDIAALDGVKPFVVMTDAQMAELSRAETPTMADLRRIEGFGESRVEKYGERLLAALVAGGPPARRQEGDGEVGEEAPE